MSDRLVRIKADERVAYVGKTGSGKTTLARYVLQSHTRLVVLDPKGTIAKDVKWNVSGDTAVARDILRGKPGRYVVSYDADWQKWFAFCWDVRNVALYIDEVFLVIENPSKPEPAFRRLYRQGRELGISVHAATQRPARIPLECISEAEWLFTFQLGLKKDRDRMAEFGDTEETLRKAIPDQHGFFTYRQGWPKAVYTRKLDLKHTTGPLTIHQNRSA